MDLVGGVARRRPNKVVFWAAATSLPAGGFVVPGAGGMIRDMLGKDDALTPSLLATREDRPNGLLLVR